MQQEDQALWLKTGPAQVLPLPRQDPGLRCSTCYLPIPTPPSEPAPEGFFPFSPLHLKRDSSVQLLSKAERGLQKLG